MRKVKLVIISFCFFVTGNSLFSQNYKGSDSLIAKAKKNLDLISVDVDKSYQEAQKIYILAVTSQDHEAELIALQNICCYYHRTYDFQKLLENAEILERKSDKYHMTEYRVLAKVFLFDVYLYNGLYNKAKQQLDQGIKILKKENSQDSLVIDSKAMLYSAYSNYYALLKNFEKRLEYIKLSVKEHEKNKTDFDSKEVLCIDYSNLAIAYFENNMYDSAEYYAWKSNEINKTGKMKNHLFFPNFVILGNIYQRRAQYEKALQYYYQAEQIEGYKNHMNIRTLYDNMIDIYQKENDTANLSKYIAKLEKLNLTIAENKNNSLSKVIDNIENKNKKSNLYFILITTLLSVTGFVMLVIIFRKKKTIIQQEKISQQYLEKELHNQNQQAYSTLIELVKNNNIAFFPAFQEAFPAFSKKLLDINPKMVQSEIEFCALLKLNFSTKDIARYRFIEARTVQNKKYHIRKKLNIPDNMDIYRWFGNI